jgi:phage terminase small subunit
MTPKQKRFVEEYLTDLNATQATIRAGYKPKRAYSTGNENLKKPEIQAAIQQAQEDYFCFTNWGSELIPVSALFPKIME